MCVCVCECVRACVRARARARAYGPRALFSLGLSKKQSGPLWLSAYLTILCSSHAEYLVSQYRVTRKCVSRCTVKNKINNRLIL